MKAYVAGRTRMFERVREVQKHLIAMGHEITFDWTSAATDDEWRSGSSEATRTDEEMLANAWADVEGVETADFVVIVSGPDLMGTLIEYGIAVGNRIPIFILGALDRPSVFDRLPLVKFVDSLDRLDQELKFLVA